MAPLRINEDVKRGSGRNGKRENKREERRDKCVVTDDGTQGHIKEEVREQNKRLRR